MNAAKRIRPKLIDPSVMLKINNKLEKIRQPPKPSIDYTPYKQMVYDNLKKHWKIILGVLVLLCFLCYRYSLNKKPPQPTLPLLPPPQQKPKQGLYNQQFKKPQQHHHRHHHHDHTHGDHHQHQHQHQHQQDSDIDMDMIINDMNRNVDIPSLDELHDQQMKMKQSNTTEDYSLDNIKPADGFGSYYSFI